MFEGMKTKFQTKLYKHISTSMNLHYISCELMLAKLATEA